MSAPNTNINKQADRHRGPLTGMMFAVVFALVLLGAFLMWTRGEGNDPAGAQAQVDGRTGEVEASDTAEGAPATDTVTNDAAAPAAADAAASEVAPAVEDGTAANTASEGTTENATETAAEPAQPVEGAATTGTTTNP